MFGSAGLGWIVKQVGNRVSIVVAHHIQRETAKNTNGTKAARCRLQKSLEFFSRCLSSEDKTTALDSGARNKAYWLTCGWKL